MQIQDSVSRADTETATTRGWIASAESESVNSQSPHPLDFYSTAASVSAGQHETALWAAGGSSVTKLEGSQKEPTEGPPGAPPGPSGARGILSRPNALPSGALRGPHTQSKGPSRRRAVLTLSILLAIMTVLLNDLRSHSDLLLLQQHRQHQQQRRRQQAATILPLENPGAPPNPEGHHSVQDCTETPAKGDKDGDEEHKETDVKTASDPFFAVKEGLGFRV